MDSIYAGFENGAWLQVRRMSELNDEQRGRLRATPGANIAINLVRPTPSGELPMRRIFEDRQGNEVGQLDLWKYGYDARRRRWYRETVKADRPLVSSPYLEFSHRRTGDHGQRTLARQSARRPCRRSQARHLQRFRPSATAWRARYRLDLRLGRLAYSPPQFCTIGCRCDDTSIPTAIAKHQRDQLRGRGGSLANVAWSRPLRRKYS